MVQGDRSDKLSRLEAPGDVDVRGSPFQWCESLIQGVFGYVGVDFGWVLGGCCLLDRGFVRDWRVLLSAMLDGLVILEIV